MIILQYGLIISKYTANSLLPYFKIFTYLHIIIEDTKKYFYYRGLKEYLNDPRYLIDTCYDGQDTIRYLTEYFDIDGF